MLKRCTKHSIPVSRAPLKQWTPVFKSYNYAFGSSVHMKWEKLSPTKKHGAMSFYGSTSKDHLCHKGQQSLGSNPHRLDIAFYCTNTAHRVAFHEQDCRAGCWFHGPHVECAFTISRYTISMKCSFCKHPFQRHKFPFTLPIVTNAILGRKNIVNLHFSNFHHIQHPCSKTEVQ